MAARGQTVKTTLTRLPDDTNLRFRPKPDRRQMAERRRVRIGGRRAGDALRGLSENREVHVAECRGNLVEG